MMIIERIAILKCVLLSAVFISLSAPGVSFAISNDSTNFTSTVSTPTVTTGTVIYRTTVRGQPPTPKTIQTNFRNNQFRSTYQGTTTSYPTLNLNSSLSCSNLDPIYSSYTNGQAQTFFRFDQNTSSAIVQTNALGLIYLRVNPDLGDSWNAMVGYKKGDGPIIEGGSGVNAFLRPFLTAFTNAIGAGDWDFRSTTTTEPGKYNIQCGYTKPTLTPVSVP